MLLRFYGFINIYRVFVFTDARVTSILICVLAYRLDTIVSLTGSD